MSAHLTESMDVMVILFHTIVENHVETYAERILSSCQQIKAQIGDLRHSYHSYHESRQPTSEC